MKLFNYKIPKFVMFLWIFLALSLFISLINDDRVTSFIGFSVFGLSIYMIYLREKINFHIPQSLLTASLIFIYATLFLGEVHDFYEQFWWWDAILHTGSALGFGLVGVILLIVLFAREHVKASPLLISIFAFSFALAIGALWEIFEFAGDQLFDMNMQKSGLVDTMWDLIVDSIGAFIASTAGYLYLKNKRLGALTDIIEEAVEEEVDNK